MWSARAKKNAIRIASKELLWIKLKVLVSVELHYYQYQAHTFCHDETSGW